MVLKLIAGSPSWLLRRLVTTGDDQLLTRALGMDFRNPVGLAAGFDKSATIFQNLADMGFGFAELGTITPLAQSGNPKPRLFRDVDRQCLFNRMGFNNDGAKIVARRIEAKRHKLPKNFRLGVNIGKNAKTVLGKAAEDYRMGAKVFLNLCDYLVINVSSPNTPALRSLQSRDEILKIVEAVLNQKAQSSSPCPILIKFAPEFRGDELHKSLSALETLGADGFVISNTLAGTHQNLSGGWSGGCLSEISKEALVELRSQTRLPVISVGGIMTSEEACRRFNLGADLIQIYSGWVFKGPSFPFEIVDALRTMSVHKSQKAV